MKKVNFRASWKFALAFAMLLQATIVPSHAAEVTSVEGGNSTKTVYYGLNDMDITITNEKMPTDDGTNVNTLIEGGNSGKYGDLFNESYGRDFEYSWTVTENHVIPVTLHFDMKQAVTLSEAIVYNAKDHTTAGSNGFVTKGQFTVKYEGMEEEVLPEITLTTEQIVPGAFFQVNLDPSKKVEKIDFTVLESTGINCMTLSEVEFNYIDATVINPEGDSDVLGIAASSYAPGDSADTLIKLLDNDSSSYFESNYNNGSLPQWVTFDLGGVYDLTDVDILARQSGTNGQVTGAEIWTSLDNSEFADNYTVEGAYTFATGADGKLTDAANYKNMHFNTVKARYVRVHITAVSATSDFFSLSEVRFYGVANKDELNAALTEAGKITDTTGYTAESVKTFTDAKAEANRVKDDSTVKAKAVAKATSDLTNAIAGLTVDKAALQKAYNDNKDKAEADYTAETWAPFKTALDAAKTVLDKADATVEEVANAKTALEAAVGNLVEKTPDPVVVDKTALQTVYNDNKDKVEADYTAETWAPFKTALDAAKTVLDKADATVEEVANAKTALEAAVGNLVEKTPDPVVVDKTALQTVYNDNKDKVEADYTAETWAPFKSALDSAKAVLDKADATAEEVANAKTALEAAVGNLVEKTPDPVVVDKTALQTVYNANKDKVEADYTAETWAPFKTVLDAAKAVLDKADATAEEVANAKTALEAAASALVKKTPEQPEDPKDTVLVDKDNNITVEAKPGVIDENTILKVESIKDFNTLTPAANKVLSSIRGKVNAFDISLLKSNVTVQPNGEITITILIPKDMDPTKVLLYHIADDGTMTTPDTVTYFNGFLKFTTDHLSVYALVEYSNPIDNNPDTDPKPVDPEKPVVPTPEKPSTTDKKSDILANTAAEDTSSNMYVVFMMLCTGAYLGLKAKRKEA